MNYETMPFGKYKGEFIEEIPSNYLIYSLENFDVPTDLKDVIKFEICKRLDLDADISIFMDDVRSIYKKLCKKHHPDVGGSNQAMQAINEFNNELKKL